MLQQQPRLAELGGCDSLSLSGCLTKCKFSTESKPCYSLNDPSLFERGGGGGRGRCPLVFVKTCHVPISSFYAEEKLALLGGYLVVYQVLHLGSLF